MIPVDQTREGKEGNCFAACIASIIERSIENVDIGTYETAEEQWAELNAKLTPLGYALIITRAGFDDEKRLTIFLPESMPYFIALGPTGNTTETGVWHAVVCKRTQQEGTKYRWDRVHDPHPSREGILVVTSLAFVVKI